MILAISKFMAAYFTLGAILLKSDVVNWGEYGLLGLVIGAVFYFLFKPMMVMMREDKQSDNEIKKQLTANINSLTLVLSEHIIKSEERLTDLKDVMKDREQKLSAVNESLSKVNESVLQLKKALEKTVSQA